MKVKLIFGAPNVKLIFEAPNLPGGLIFTAVVPAGYDMARAEEDAIWAAGGTGLRLKGSEPTDDPFGTGLRLALERFDLGRLLDQFITARGGVAGLSGSEQLAVEMLNRRIQVEVRGGPRLQTERLNALPLPPSAHECLPGHNDWNR